MPKARFITSDWEPSAPPMLAAGPPCDGDRKWPVHLRAQFLLAAAVVLWIAAAVVLWLVFLVVAHL